MGKLADFVILSDNPLTIDEDKLADIKVLETIKEDKSIYKRPAGAAALSSPAMFGITLNEAHDAMHSIPGVKSVCGDGEFSPTLSVLINAANNEKNSEYQAQQ